MKRVLAITVVMTLLAGAAMAQSANKASTTRSTLVKDKKPLKLVAPEKTTQLKTKVNKEEAKRMDTTKPMTQSELNARREEWKKNPKKSTKPNQN